MHSNIKIYTLQDICDFLNGFAFKSKNYVKNGIRVIRIANVQKGKIIDTDPCFYPIGTKKEIARYILRENDLLISLTGNVGRVGLLPNALLPAALNQRVSCLRIKNKNDVLPKYLFYYFQQNSFESACIQASSGVAQLNLSTKWLENYEIPLPTLPEQERIVQKIEELFADLDKGIEELEQAKVRLKIYRQAVLKDAFAPFIKLNPITDFFDISGGLTKNSRRNDFETKLPYLRVANVYYNFLDLTEIKKIGVQPTEIERTRLQANDLLFVEGNGSKEQIGRVAVWDGSIENCLHQNHIIKGRPNGKMLSLYALFFLISKSGRDQILSVASSTSGLYTLSISKIKNLKIPFCNIGEQEQIINEIEAKLSTCDKQEQVVNESLQKAENLRQSILKQAFEGRLL